ncbi:MAG: RNA 2'-phosphotransferase [Desulfobacteraceae bacterium]
MKKNRIKIHDLSRIMIYILGHSPHEYGLVPDDRGFITFKELLWAIHEEPDWSHVSQGSINELLMSDERHHFETNEKSIRAVTRHWELNLFLPADHVPSLLYTPIRRKAHYAALDKGLINRGNKPYVLTTGKAMAERIGKRRDQKPVILEVMSGRAKDEGTHFYPFGEFFLAQEILPRYIAGPPVPKDIIKLKETGSVKKKEAAPDFSAGTFTLDINRDPDLARRKKGQKKKGWREEVRGKRRKS